MRSVMSWDALRVFLAVHRAGSFSAAADELGVAQSSVSEQVARLERNLGYTLLDRTPSGVRATERGIELAARIAAPVDALAAAAALTEETDCAERIVFVGGPAEFLSEVVLPGLADRLPAGIRVMARFGLAEDLIDDLHAGEIEVLVSALPVRGTDLSPEPVYDEEFALVAHPNWAARAEQNLAAVPLLAYGPELPIIRRYWRSVFGRRPDDLAVRIIAPDLRALLRLALSGAGMTVLPDYLVREHLASGALVALDSPEVAPLNTLYVATRKTSGHLDPVVASVREAIVEIGQAAG
ncbi:MULTISPECIES: LysR family transcriptional regulator [Microbacterium]|uniref:LysR family transcriptional regulator n=1 Tax=Microbacterium TaxID=33882 RepID=UPI00217D9BE1|nr:MULTISPECIES: LysR family transcriptional regulator [Microbacterium]UWF78416.1 LysR family transcriptional regulator [Microbacterium neungamense]WCM56591.1 LysR family transcriptional regulator [Microbacterium sp. EF45047]